MALMVEEKLVISQDSPEQVLDHLTPPAALAGLGCAGIALALCQCRAEPGAFGRSRAAGQGGESERVDYGVIASAGLQKTVDGAVRGAQLHVQRVPVGERE